jgi:hypothetical protein
MVFDWMLDDYSELIKLKAVGDDLASYSDWPVLYDEEQLAKICMLTMGSVWRRQGRSEGVRRLLQMLCITML